MTSVTPTRRTVLIGAGAVGASAALAACGGDDDTSTSGSTGGVSSEPGEDTATSGAGTAEALTKTADVPVGGGVILDGPKIVVTQPAAGDFKAFTAVCTHQHCLVGSVQDNVITCPCHGSKYSAEDGSVENGPAPAPLAAVSIKVEGDSIVQA
jgi:Rieske Fe-S protein